MKPQFSRERDVIVITTDDRYTVSVSPNMMQRGWAGGQGVMWTHSDLDEFIVDYSTGNYGGFLLNGSNEASDQLISTTGQQSTYGYGVVCTGNWIIATSTYERYTYASRIGPGPLVPIFYIVGQRLVFSVRGLFTPETNEGRINELFIANIIQAPSADNNYYLTLQTSI